MASRKSYGANVGSSSILLIFILLCLVSFAALSIVSANTDHKLGQKILTRTASYYEACNLAEESIASLDRELWDIYEASENAEEYFAAAGSQQSYSFPISDLQELDIQIEILYPEKSGDTCYRIKSWQVISKDSL